MRIRARSASIAVAGLLVGLVALADPAPEAEADDERSGDASAEAEAEVRPEAPQEPSEGPQAGSQSDEEMVYVPPSRGSARVRTGGGTRGPAPVPTLAVLAPDHVGVTNRAQPTLAWFLSTPTEARIDLTLMGPDAVDPLLEVTLPTLDRGGIHLVRLADYDVRLEPGPVYDWSVALVVDPDRRDLDVVATGAIRRDPPSPAIATAVESGTPSHVALARAGVWYDAMADLSAAIVARPEDAALRAQRASLLEQVGVGAAAAYERENDGHGESPGSP